MEAYPHKTTQQNFSNTVQQFSRKKSSRKIIFRQYFFTMHGAWTVHARLRTEHAWCVLCRHFHYEVAWWTNLNNLQFQSAEPPPSSNQCFFQLPYSGKSCERRRKPNPTTCNANTCKNNGQCRNEPQAQGGFLCNCPIEYRLVYVL